jgi:membrane-associated HD superfamily phosphohydrolase
MAITARAGFAIAAFVYVISAAVLRFAYMRIVGARGASGPTGMELSTTWWVATGLYFVGDLTLLAALSWMAQILLDHSRENGLFRLTLGDVFIVVSLWHFTMFIFEYRVSARLQSVGLGSIEGIVPAIFVIGFAPLFYRAIKAGLNRS